MIIVLTASGRRIVQFTFSQSLWNRFKIEAHQQTGVQADTSVVAVHREGFAEIGVVASDGDMEEIKGFALLDHNPGFTSAQKGTLKSLLTQFEEISCPC